MEVNVNALRISSRGTRGTPTSVLIKSALREQIIDLTLPPGTAISEKQISEFYQVSRTPVRDALLRLAEEQLIEVYPQRGTFVSRISLDAVQDAMVMRKALERVTVRDAALKAGPAQIGELRAIIERQRAHDAADDLASFHAADDDLHQAISAIGRHTNIWRIVKSEKASVERCRNLSTPVTGRRKQVMAQHFGIVEAIAAADPDAADRAMAAHLADVLPGLDELRRSHPSYFESDRADYRTARSH